MKQHTVITFTLGGMDSKGWEGWGGGGGGGGGVGLSSLSVIWIP